MYFISKMEDDVYAVSDTVSLNFDILSSNEIFLLTDFGIDIKGVSDRQISVYDRSAIITKYLVFSKVFDKDCIFADNNGIVLLDDICRDNTEDTLVIPGFVDVITERALSRLTGVKSITIKDGISVLLKSVFSFCKDLEEVILSNSIRTISSNCFDNCNVLKSIVLPEGLYFVGEGCFSHCWALSNIVIPKSLTFISTRMFDNCLELKSIFLHDYIKSIGNYEWYSFY